MRREFAGMHRYRGCSDSPFAVRGVIEGFYGTPWSHAQRLDLISFLAEVGMNAYFYSPKDDPMLRRKWRSPYAGGELERLMELVGRCREANVRFVFCLSPGMSISYASGRDVGRVVQKLRSVGELGVTSFGLFLDDIPLDLQHEADLAAYGSLVDAHVDLVRSVQEGLPNDASLTVCPTVYSGFGDEDYVAQLGRSIDPRIDVFWTGRRICAPTLDLSDAAVFQRSAFRPALYWDNYPVNDLGMAEELHVGPYRGRDRHLYRFARGVVANGMELYESSKIAFATIADYLNAPEAYEPESSWAAAIRLVAGDADAAAYALFADNVRLSCLAESDAPKVSAALGKFIFQLQRGESSRAGRELGAVAAGLATAAEQLLGGGENQQLVTEGRPWIEKFALGAGVMADLARLAQDDVPLALWREGLLQHHAAIVDNPKKVFGSVLEMALRELLEMGAWDE